MKRRTYWILEAERGEMLTSFDSRISDVEQKPKNPKSEKPLAPVVVIVSEPLVVRGVAWKENDALKVGHRKVQNQKSVGWEGPGLEITEPELKPPDEYESDKLIGDPNEVNPVHANRTWSRDKATYSSQQVR